MTHCRRVELSFPTAAAFAIHNVRCLPGKGFHLFLVRAEGIRVRMHMTWHCTVGMNRTRRCCMPSSLGPEWREREEWWRFLGGSAL